MEVASRASAAIRGMNQGQNAHATTEIAASGAGVTPTHGRLPGRSLALPEGNKFEGGNLLFPDRDVHTISVGNGD